MMLIFDWKSGVGLFLVIYRYAVFIARVFELKLFIVNMCLSEYSTPHDSHIELRDVSSHHKF